MGVSGAVQRALAGRASPDPEGCRFGPPGTQQGPRAAPFLAGGLADEAPVDALAAQAEDLDDPPYAVDSRAFLIARRTTSYRYN
jgi:hypothetical protein